MNRENNDSTQLNILLRDGIAKYLNKTGWTLRMLSEKSGVPYETIKKLANAKIPSPLLTNVLKISAAFKITPDALLGFDSGNIFSIENLSRHSQKFLVSVIQLEKACQKLNSSASEAYFVPLLNPAGSVYDGMIYGAFMLSAIDVSKYADHIKNNIVCAFKINSDSFMPFMQSGDILLLASGKVPYGKICVIIHNGRIYFRKYSNCGEMKYKPLTPTSNKLSLSSHSNVITLGYVAEIIKGQKED